jgi:hypothetical protein
LLENVLNEDKSLIMIESSKFKYASCLPDYEFYIIAINKCILKRKNNNPNLKNNSNLKIENLGHVTNKF